MRSKGREMVTRGLRARHLWSASDPRDAAGGKSPVVIAYLLLGALLAAAFTARLARVGAFSWSVYDAAFVLDAASIAALLTPAVFRLRAGAVRGQPLPRAVTMAWVTGEKGLAGCLGASLMLACRVVFAWPVGWPLACAAATWFALCLGLTSTRHGEHRGLRRDG